MLNPARAAGALKQVTHTEVPLYMFSFCSVGTLFCLAFKMYEILVSFELMPKCG